MKDISISEMMDMQMELWNMNKDIWNKMEPTQARNMMLWMIEEIGEAIAIIKKKGEMEIMENGEVRESFIEEMVDIMMYYSAVMLRLEITPEEYASIYHKKQNKNKERNFKKQYDDFISGNNGDKE